MTFRSICIAVYVFFYLISTTPARIRLKKLEQSDPQEASRIAQKYIQKVFHVLLKISGVTVDVKGLENIPKEAALFVGNHSSYFDIIVTGATIPGGVGFVAKDSLGNIPGLSSWMKRIHCLFLDRKDVRKGLKTILEGADYLKEGYSMCIYPEGTRSTTGELGEFKGGSLKMAQKAKAPIVPVAITGTRDIFENNPGLRVYPSHVTISFGKPFKIAELPAAEKKFAGEYAKKAIEEMLAEQQ